MSNKTTLIGGPGVYVVKAPGGGGTVTGADNGLSLAGTVVELGGSLIKATTIDTSPNFNLVFSNTNAGGDSTEFNFLPGVVAISFANAAFTVQSSMQISGNSAFLFGEDDTKSCRAILNAFPLLQPGNTALGLGILGFDPNIQQAGIDFNDLFIKYNKAQTVSNVLFSTSIPGSAGAVFRINLYLYPTVLGIGSNIIGSFHYTDTHGNNQTFNFPTVNSVNPTAFSPVIFAVGAGGLFDLEVTITGTATYDAFVHVERLASLN